MDAFFHFLNVVVLCVTGLIALALVLIVAVCYLPDSPAKDIIRTVTKRVGATAAVAAIGIPIEPIHGLDGLYDIAALLFLLVYWFGALKDIRDALRRRSQPDSEKAVGSIPSNKKGSERSKIGEIAIR